MSVDVNPSGIIRGGNWALWTDILGPPIFWLWQLQLNYMLVPWACTSGHHLPLHLSALVFFLMTCAFGISAWRHWSAVRERGEEQPAQMRLRFMAIVGVMMSSLFALAIFVQGVATFIIGPCQD